MGERRRGRWKECTFVLAAVCIALIIILIIVSVLKQKEIDEVFARGAWPCKTADENIKIYEPEEPPIFADLTQKELRAVADYLMKQDDLNLVLSAEAMVNSSYIYVIELDMPNKAEVLAHLDSGAEAPGRTARVVLFRGDLNVPVVEEYRVSPLPTPTSHELIQGRGVNPIAFAYRPLTFTEFNGISKHILPEIDRKLEKLLLESFDAKFIDCGDKCLTYFVAPVSTSNYDMVTRNIWLWINHAVDYYTIHPLDFQVLVNLDGNDVTKYHITKVWYDQQDFDTLSDLMAAYDMDTVNVKVPFPAIDHNLFSTLHRRGDPQPAKPNRRPFQLEPDGKRYTVDGQHVEYMGWAFDYRMSTTTGPGLFDIRYRGERIVYELSLQEISVFYSGYNPTQRFADYVDSTTLIGSMGLLLVPGSDCPDHATFLPARHFMEGSDEPIVIEKAFCLFEQDTGMPLKRHHSGSKHGGSFYGGMPDDVLILRTVLNVYNYDYIFDFIFHQSGAIEVRTASTGYIIASYYSSAEDSYGWNIHNNIIGTIHMHMFHFKADVDIMGTSNRFETLNVELEQADNRKWSSVKDRYAQIKFTRDVKQTETQAAYNFNFDQPKYLIFHNEAEKTEQNVPRAYRLHSNGFCKQMIPPGQGAEPSISWSRYQVAVTKQKDSEPRSSSLYGIWDAYDPVMRFQEYIDDNESTVDEDLVAWVTLGLHHIPHTEDLPITPTVGSHLQFFLLPYNYFPEDPSTSSRSNIYIELDPRNGTKSKVELSENDASVKCVGKRNNFLELVLNNSSLVFNSAAFG